MSCENEYLYMIEIRDCKFESLLFYFIFMKFILSIYQIIYYIKIITIFCNILLFYINIITYMFPLLLVFNYFFVFFYSFSFFLLLTHMYKNKSFMEIHEY
jgi:hypothetical protein